MSNVYILQNGYGKLLDPVQQATVLAQYARSDRSAADIIEETTASKSEAFHEKWIVNYGHNSVAELAVIPICLEDISIIATKAIEAWQRPAYCERSTRMQKFSSNSFYNPLEDAPEEMLSLVEKAYALYQDFTEVLPKYMMEKYPELPASAIKRKVFDSARYLLPAGTKTSMTCVANLRDVADMVRVLGASQLTELRNIAHQIKHAASSVGGPLIRHTEPNTWVEPKLLPYSTAGGPNRIFNVTASGMPDSEMRCCLESAYEVPELHKRMRNRPEHHPGPSAFRNSRIKFHISMDYGAFRDLQRHRRTEQEVGLLTTNLGYEVPELPPEQTGQYVALMTKFQRCLSSIAPNPANQYFVPMGFRISFSMEMDLEELYYIVELRTQPQGHISYRKIAYEMYKEASYLYPWTMQWCRPCKEGLE